MADGVTFDAQADPRTTVGQVIDLVVREVVKLPPSSNDPDFCPIILKVLSKFGWPSVEFDDVQYIYGLCQRLLGQLNHYGDGSTVITDKTLSLATIPAYNPHLQTTQSTRAEAQSTLVQASRGIRDAGNVQKRFMFQPQYGITDTSSQLRFDHLQHPTHSVADGPVSSGPTNEACQENQQMSGVDSGGSHPKKRKLCHPNEVSQPDNGKKFNCPTCTGLFQTFESLRWHKSRTKCSGTFGHECETCKKIIKGKRLDNFKRHHKVVHGVTDEDERQNLANKARKILLEGDTSDQQNTVDFDLEGWFNERVNQPLAEAYSDSQVEADTEELNFSGYNSNGVIDVQTQIFHIRKGQTTCKKPLDFVFQRQHDGDPDGPDFLPPPNNYSGQGSTFGSRLIPGSGSSSSRGWVSNSSRQNNSATRDTDSDYKTHDKEIELLGFGILLMASFVGHIARSQSSPPWEVLQEGESIITRNTSMRYQRYMDETLGRLGCLVYDQGLMHCIHLQTLQTPLINTLRPPVFEFSLDRLLHERTKVAIANYVGHDSTAIEGMHQVLRRVIHRSFSPLADAIAATRIDDLLLIETSRCSEQNDTETKEAITENIPSDPGSIAVGSNRKAERKFSDILRKNSMEIHRRKASSEKSLPSLACSRCSDSVSDADSIRTPTQEVKSMELAKNTDHASKTQNLPISMIRWQNESKVDGPWNLFRLST